MTDQTLDTRFLTELVNRTRGGGSATGREILEAIGEDPDGADDLVARLLARELVTLVGEPRLVDQGAFAIAPTEAGRDLVGEGG